MSASPLPPCPECGATQLVGDLRVDPKPLSISLIALPSAIAYGAGSSLMALRCAAYLWRHTKNYGEPWMWLSLALAVMFVIGHVAYLKYRAQLSACPRVAWWLTALVVLLAASSTFVVAWAWIGLRMR